MLWYPNHIEPGQASECILNYRAFNDEEIEEKACATVTKSVRELFPDIEPQKEQKESPDVKEVISRKPVNKTSQTSPSAEENNTTEHLLASTKCKPTEKKVDKEIREFLHGFPKYYFKTVSSILRALEEKFQRSDAIDVLRLTDEDLANPSMMSFRTSICINKFVGKSVTFASK